MSGHRSRLPLTALRTFEAAARHLSFKAAAAELFVSPTTVSNQIRNLERQWGCPLFVRKTRAVLLTDAGRSLAAVLGRAFADIRAEIDTHVAVAPGAVSLAVGPIFGLRWLSPRLARFRDRHPDIELVLHHGPRITGVEAMSGPLAVDWGDGQWHGVEVEPLFPIVYSPVVAPALLAERGPLRRPADLARFPLIHQRDRSEWLTWLRLAGQGSLHVREETVAMDSNVVVQAAIDAQAVALGTFPFLQGELDAGRLERPFAIASRPPRSYFLLLRPGARSVPEVDAVCTWLLEEAARHRASRPAAELAAAEAGG